MVPRWLRRWTTLRLVVLLAVLAGVAGIFSGGLGPRCKGAALCYEGTINQVVDGDTLDIGERRVRLALVDTPEVGEAGYEEAKAFAASLCRPGSNALVDEDDGQTGGSSGRIVAVVYCGGANLNARLLRAGHATFVPEFCPVSEFATEPWASACR